MSILKMLLAVVAASIVSTQTGAQIMPIRPVTINERIHVGVEGSRVRLNRIGIISNPGASYSSYASRIGLSDAGHWFTITNLDGLRDKVQVKDGALALRLVRLRTSYSTYRLWPGSHYELEVVNASTVTRQPNYGLSFPSIANKSSGVEGILSEQAFRAGGFTAPSIVQTAEGFFITRWLFIWDYQTIPVKTRLEHVREFVGRDGHYQRAVILKESPPNLPGTYWNVPW